jgi:hypothetical protein
MLKLWFGDPKNIHYVHSAKLIFDEEYEPEWLMEDKIKAMIKDIDKSEVISGNLIESPIFGPIPPKDLSGGVKTLIMASHDDSRIYNLTSCGDNCAKWVIELAKDRDIVMRLGHVMNFKNIKDFEVYNMATGEILTTFIDYLHAVEDAPQFEG